MLGEIFSGGLSGAASGGAMGGGWGALVGGGLGLAGGYFQGQANKKAEKAQAQARAELKRVQQDSYTQRMRDLDRAMQYFAPVQQRLSRLYGPGANGPALTGPSDPMAAARSAGQKAKGFF